MPRDVETQARTRPAARGTRLALFQEIVRCTEMVACLEGRSGPIPCASVVGSQWVGRTDEERAQEWRSLHQLPEPWVGRIAVAPVLFVSSNPSIGGIGSQPVPGETHNRWGTDDGVMLDVFESAFETYIEDGKRISGSRAVMYWAAIKKRAEELMPDRLPIRPGLDYAITEVVRCKSKGELGVSKAVATCVDRYLDKTLEISGADVIVGVGRHARRALEHHFSIRGAPAGSVTTITCAGRARKLVCIPHPNARAQKTFAKCVSPESLEELRSLLAARS